MAEIHERRPNEAKIDTILADDIHFTGEVSFTKELMIKGRYSGKIHSSGDLYIDKEAEVEADIVANSVYIWGSVRGNINAVTRVELQDDAVVVGDITAPKIVMGIGCRFDGMSRMRAPKEEAT